MNPNEILAALELKFAGRRRDGLEQLAQVLALQFDTIEKAQAAIDAMSEQRVDDFIKEYRKKVDAEILKSNQTTEKNLRNKYDFVEKKDEKTPPPNPNEPPSEEVPAWAKSLIDEVNSLKSEKATATRRAALEKVFANDTPESYKKAILGGFEARTFKSNEEFNSFLESTRTDAQAFMQELADKGLSAHSKPALGAVNEDGVSQDVKTYVESKQKAAEEGKSSPLGGKQL